MTILFDRQLRAPMSFTAHLAWAAYVAVRDKTVNRHEFLKLARLYFDLNANADEADAFKSGNNDRPRP